MDIINIKEEDLNNNMCFFEKLNIKPYKTNIEKLFDFVEYNSLENIEKNERQFSTNNLLQQRIVLNYNYVMAKKYELAYKEKCDLKDLDKMKADLIKLSEKILKDNLDKDKK